MTGLLRYREVIAERKRLVIITFCATVLVCLVISLLWPPVYKGTATLLLDYDSGSPINLGGQTASYGTLDSGEYINTQIELIKSRRVAVGVVDLLKLDSVPGIIDEFKSARTPNPLLFWKKKADPDIRVWLADEFLSKYLDVEPARDTRLLYINFSSSNPEFSAAVANAYAQVYTNYSLELKVMPFRDASKWFEGKLAQVRNKADQTSEMLREYQKKKGIIASGGQLYDDAVQSLDRLNRELADAKGKLYEAALAERRAKESKGRYGSLPEVLSNSFIQNLKSQKVTLEAGLSDLAGKVGGKNPEYVRRKSELQTIRAKLDSEMQEIVDSIHKEYAIASDRVKTLQAAVARQKGHALDSNISRYKLDSLNMESDVSKEAYEAVLKKFNESLLDGDMNRTNVFFIDAAVPPAQKSSPDLLLNIPIAAIAGLLLGIGLAFFADYRDDTLRHAEAVEEQFRIAVLGAIAYCPYR